jgi:outer membrane protein TolC
MKRLNSRYRSHLGAGSFLTPLTLVTLATLTAVAILVSGVRAQEPLTLPTAMGDVLRNSEEAQLLTEKETRLQAEKGEVLGAALPNVQIYADAGRGATPFYIGSFPTQILGADSAGTKGGGASSGGFQRTYDVQENQFDYGVQVSQPLFSFRIGQAYHVAGIILHSQAEANRRARQQLELQTLDAFYALITARARIVVTEAAIKRQSETVGFLQSNLQMGSGQRSSVLLAVSSLKALVPDRIRAERDTDAARMALNRLVGRPIEAPLEIDTAVPDYSIPNIDTSGAGLQNILAERPDLASLRLQKESLQGQATYSRMQYLPSLGLQGKLGILAFEPDGQLYDFTNNLNWQVGVGLQWNIFDGFTQSSKAREFDSDARGMALTERQSWAEARIEIATALRDADAADTAYEASLDARDAASDAQRLLADDFHAGKGQITDLLSSEEGLRNAELSLVDARYQKVRAHAALRVALGMDLMEEESK